jgi:tetratricopeptide (TPR) repeat protein
MIPWLARLLRRIAALAAVIGILILARALAGGRAALVTALVLFGLLGLILIVLPRMAHRAFRRGSFSRAALLYGLLAHVRLDRSARGALRLSVAACLLGRERYRDGLALLARIDPASLGESARAAWHNNRAYAFARSGGDPAQALIDSDAAITMRPDVTGFRHTRGLALLGLDRVDEAIRELDLVWQRGAGDDTPPLFEAERCYDIGLAWARKGERDYAADYFERAVRAAPGSAWAIRAAARLEPSSERLPDAVADLV